MHNDGTFEPGDKARCTHCSRVVRLDRVEENREFRQYEWRSLDGDTHCRRREVRRHEPRRVPKSQRRRAA